MAKLKLLPLIILLSTPSANLLAQSNDSDWRDELAKQLPFLGHRNWILVVDAAYPLQSKPAIKTITAKEKHLDVIREVLRVVDKAQHISPEIFLDREIDFVPESEAKGMEAYKKGLYSLLEGKDITKLLHEELIANIDEAAEIFNILVVKTELTIPYTSVFLRLDCGYWNSDQEKKIRDLMK